MLVSFLKKEHFVPSVQSDELAFGVDGLVIWLSFEWFTLSRLFFTRFK